MDFLGNLVTGFAVALTPINLLYCFLGSLIGTAIGVLPGLGPPATIALLLPVTYGIPATSAVILLAVSTLREASTTTAPSTSSSGASRHAFGAESGEPVANVNSGPESGRAHTKSRVAAS